MFEQVNYVLAG